MTNELEGRKLIRLKEYDYSNEGMYFITICTKNRECILGKIENGSVKTDPYMVLNRNGILIESELNNIHNHFRDINIDEYVIMPNHIHFILNIIKKDSITVPTIVGLFKSGVSRILEYSIWQRNYYEHIIRNEKEYYKIKKYIIENPINWVNDKLYKSPLFGNNVNN